MTTWSLQAIRIRSITLCILFLKGSLMAEEPSDSSTLPDFDKLWNYEQPEETEKVFRKILPIARASGDSDYLAQLITQIARTNSLRREFEASHSLLDEAEKMLSPETPIGRVRYLLERGRTHNSAQQLQEASTHFREAFELADSLGQDFHAVDAAHMMGIVKKGDIALQWNERAMKVAEASADERAKRWLGALYNNTGWTYHDSGSYERALELFEKGLAWRKERGDGKPTLIAKWTIARTLRSLRRTEEALEHQLNLLEEYKASEYGRTVMS